MSYRWTTSTMKHREAFAWSPQTVNADLGDTPLG